MPFPRLAFEIWTLYTSILSPHLSSFSVTVPLTQDSIMASKTPILTDKAPKPLPGIYSQAIVAGGVVYCSGAVAMDPETGKLIDGDVKAHTVCTPG